MPRKTRRNKAGESTHEKIIATAEQLFSKKGFGETQLQEITEGAGVNIAAVNYYFGSKEGVFETILARQFDPILEKRITALHDIQKAAEKKDIRPDVGKLLSSWIDPLLEAFFAEDGRAGLILDLELELNRSIERNEVTNWPVAFMEYAQEFRHAVVAALPDLPASEVLWRVEILCSSVLPTLRGTVLPRMIGKAESARERDNFRAAWLRAGQRLLSK